MTEPIKHLLRALDKTQDWSGTYIGDCAEAVEDLLPNLDALVADRDGYQQIARSFDGIASRAVAENAELRKAAAGLSLEIATMDALHTARIAALERENAALREIALRLDPVATRVVLAHFGTPTTPEEPR